jgi:hypothetical protein
MPNANAASAAQAWSWMTTGASVSGARLMANPLRGSDLGPASAETTFTVSNYVSAGTPLRMT